MAKKQSKFAIDAKRLASSIREGKVLCIDPASGGSLPGYALFQGSTWVESGEIAMSKRKQQPHQRYRQILQTLQSNPELFGDVDVLCIEYIPPFMGSRGGDFRTQGVVNLHRSVAISSGVLDSLPHNGYGVTTIRAICGETHRAAYGPMAALTVLVPGLGLALCLLLFALGL